MFHPALNEPESKLPVFQGCWLATLFADKDVRDNSNTRGEFPHPTDVCPRTVSLSAKSPPVVLHVADNRLLAFGAFDKFLVGLPVIEHADKDGPGFTSA